jgi:hypothetical protein
LDGLFDKALVDGELILTQWNFAVNTKCLLLVVFLLNDGLILLLGLISG